MRKGCRFAIVGVIIAACVIGLIFAGYWFNWSWTGFGPETTEPKQHAKTLWDWLQLLVIPAVLAIAGYAINFTINRNEQKSTRQRDQTEHEITTDNQREQALQTYIDKMSELLVHEHLRESKQEDEVRMIARSHTLTVLRLLNGQRRTAVLEFLNDCKLINKDNPIVFLVGAKFEDASLIHYNLAGVGLVGARMSKINLSEADLHEADLRYADLSGANLREADLSKTILVEAYLTGANLTGANLSGAIGTTPEQLAKAASLKGATMPDGKIHP
jgi:hypothetical protein